MNSVTDVVNQFLSARPEVAPDVLIAILLACALPALAAIWSARLLLTIGASVAFCAALVDAAAKQEWPFAFIALGLLWLGGAVARNQMHQARAQNALESRLSDDSLQLATFLEQIDRRAQLIDAHVRGRRADAGGAAARDATPTASAQTAPE